jgi:hypothetical protein
VQGGALIHESKVSKQAVDATDQESQRTKPVVDCHHNGAALGETTSVVFGASSAPLLKGTAVQPDKHGQSLVPRSVSRRSKYVKIQTIFRHACDFGSWIEQGIDELPTVGTEVGSV